MENPTTIERQKQGADSGAAPLLAGVESEQPQDEKWNPCKWRGTKWVTLRETTHGLFASIWYEIERNKIGRVTVIPPYGWDEEKRKTKNDGHWTTLDKQLSELLTEEQAVEKLLASEKWSGATVIMCGCKPIKNREHRC